MSWITLINWGGWVSGWGLGVGSRRADSLCDQLWEGGTCTCGYLGPPSSSCCSREVDHFYQIRVTHANPSFVSSSHHHYHPPWHSLVMMVGLWCVCIRPIFALGPIFANICQYSPIFALGPMTQVGVFCACTILIWHLAFWWEDILSQIEVLISLRSWEALPKEVHFPIWLEHVLFWTP